MTWFTTQIKSPIATITKIFLVMKIHDSKVNKTTQIQSNFNKLNTLDTESFFHRTYGKTARAITPGIIIGTNTALK